MADTARRSPDQEKYAHDATTCVLIRSRQPKGKIRGRLGLARQLRQLGDVHGNRRSLTMGVKRKGPWRSLGGCCQELRSVCVRGAELLPCALADKDALGHRLRAMGASFYLSRSPLAALRLRPLGQFRTELLPPPRLAAPSATADRPRRAPSLNRPGGRPCLPPACNPVPGLYGKARNR